jgi:hypothetical protein
MSPLDISDGCTGFSFLEPFFTIRGCCVVHDTGGTDGQLLDCLMANTPGWSWPLVALCVAAMIFFRPLYHWAKPWLHPILLKMRALLGR